MANDSYLEMLVRIERKMDEFTSELKDINSTLGGLDCKVHTAEISLLKKVVYGGVGVILLAWLAGTFSNNNNNQGSVIASDIKPNTQVVQPKGK